MEKYHQKTIDFSELKTGQEIMDALQVVAEESGLTYQCQVNRDEPRTLKVGMSSGYPYRHVAVLTGDKLDVLELNPDASYERVAVGSFFWGGGVYLVGYGQVAVEKAVEEIAGKVLDKLK